MVVILLCRLFQHEYSTGSDGKAAEQRAMDPGFHMAAELPPVGPAVLL